MDHEFVVGMDPHPDTHTACVVDENGKVVHTLRVKNTPEGFKELRGWASGFEGRVWAIEGASNPFVSSWVSELLAAGEEVVNIPPSMTSQYRCRHSRKKNDLVDAHNAARALLANPELPPYAPPAQQRRLQVLSRTRRRLAVQLKANRMALKDMPEEFAEEREVLKEIVRCLSEQLKRLEALMGHILKESAPEILAIRGVGPVLGATIVGEVGEVSRFGSVDKFSSYCGGPTERSSGKNSRASVNSGGNRTMNYVVHMIAQVRLRTDGGRSRALVERKQREGKTLRAALRVLKTYIARELYRRLRAMHTRPQAAHPITA
jgi:transposase